MRYIPTRKEVRPKSPPEIKFGSNKKMLISCPECTFAYVRRTRCWRLSLIHI